VRLLVIEDEAVIRESLREDLTKQGYNVDVAADGEEGLFAGMEYPIDVAIVDLGLPKMSGLQVIRKLRQSGKKFPILILTARDRWQDKVEGLDAGADDYVAKPFHFEEIHARLQALIRRAGGWATSELVCGPIMLDTKRHTVKVNDKPVDLTTYEYRLLEHFMLRVGEVLSRTELSERIYEEDLERDSNVVEVYLMRLRRKLDPNNEIKPFETVRGRGYKFVIPRKTE
jgi:two-component system, OmpR family, response regulator PhoP